MRVVGVTSVGDELFLLLCRNEDQVAVYSTNDYKLLRHLSVPECNPDGIYSDITSCVRRKCLYMSDCHNRCIHRYALSSSATSKWPLSFKPFSLSVTPNGNLLVVCCDPKLVELSAESGKQVREISLQEDIKELGHGIQLANGQFVVCHGYFSDPHRVCMVDDDGRVTHSYCGKEGSGDRQLKAPLHLAVDEDSQLIFVANSCNNRVVELSPTMEFVRYISERVYRPHRLHLDQSTRRLYVARNKCGVIVPRDNSDIIVIQL